MAKAKKPSEPRLDTVLSSVTVPAKEFLTRLRAGEFISDLHDQRMTKADKKVYQKMTPDDQSSVDNVVVQLRTGLANNSNRVWLEQKRAEIFKKYS